MAVLSDSSAVAGDYATSPLERKISVWYPELPSLLAEPMLIINKADSLAKYAGDDGG